MIINDGKYMGNPKNRLDNFDAEKARKLSEKSVDKELQWVLQEIEKTAESGSGHFLYVNRELGSSTIYDLEIRGFVINKSQYNPLKYLITW